MMRKSVRKYFLLIRLGIMCGLIAGLTVMSGASAAAQPAPFSGLAGSIAAPNPSSDEPTTAEQYHIYLPVIAQGWLESDPFTTAEQYLTTFYPLWFTYNQSQISSHNRLVGPDRVTPLYHAVVAINVDTLYASTVVELATQPIVLTIPATPVTYSILTLDQYGNVMDSGIPKQTPGMYVLTGPGYSDPLPPELTQIPMPLNYFILIFRADKHTPDGDSVLAEAEVFRATLNMKPLCAYEGQPCPGDQLPGGSTLILPEVVFGIPFKTIADEWIQVDPIGFLRDLQEAVASPMTPPLSPSEQALSDHFNEIFGAGEFDTKSQFAAGARAAHQAILDNYLMNVGPTQWIHFTDMGHWGDKVLNRASITEFIQYGNDISAAAYYHTFNDVNGNPLDGNDQQGYTLTFPPGTLPEKERFWSITAYTPDSVELIRNPAQKYVLGNYTTGLEYAMDGTLTIYISRNKPEGVPEANWLPVAEGPFNIMLRVYGVVPDSDVAKNTYVPPGIVGPG